MHNSRSVPNRQACLPVFSRPRELVVDHGPVVRRQCTDRRGVRWAPKSRQSGAQWQRAISLPYIYGSCRHAFVPHCVDEVGGRFFPLSFSLLCCLASRILCSTKVPSHNDSPLPASILTLRISLRTCLWICRRCGISVRLAYSMKHLYHESALLYIYIYIYHSNYIGNNGDYFWQIWVVRNHFLNV